MQYTETYDLNKLKFLSTINLEKYTNVTHKENTNKTDIKATYKIFKKFVDDAILNNGEIKPKYTQNNERGRYYARSPSVQQLCKHVRGFLCLDTTTDIDIKNCYPVILKYICNNHNILCPLLTYYIEHREELFKTYSLDKDYIKTQIFTIMFGGKSTLHDKFIEDFKKEYNTIQKKLLNIKEYKHYFENLEKYRYNKQGSATFKIIEDVEIEIISKTIDFLKNKNYEIFAYMYDGIMIHGLHYENNELLNELNLEINKHFPKLNIEFVYKKHIINQELDELWNDFDINEYDENQLLQKDNSYESCKREFEKTCAKIINRSLFIVEEFKDNKIIDVKTFTESKLIISYKHLECITDTGKKGEKSGCFINKWLHDVSMRTYKDIDIFPPGVPVPDKYYNMWIKFDMELIDEYEYKQEALEKILNHIKIICGNDKDIYEYFIKWIAYVIQFPSKKTICPVFISKEGAGKGTLFGLFRRMLGDSKVLESTNPERDVWGNFNGEMANSYLVNINELGKMQQQNSTGKIKGLITDEELIINQKGLPQSKIKSYHKFIITTNSEDPVYTDKNDRRFFVIRSSDEKIGNHEYFNEMHNLIEDDNVVKTCYEYFKNLPDISNFKNIERPISEYHENLKELNKSVVELFLEHIYDLNKKKESVEYKSEELYEEFKKYTEDNGIRYETSSLKLLCSIRNLKFESISKHRTKTHNTTVINIEKLKKDLNFADSTSIKKYIIKPDN